MIFLYTNKFTYHSCDDGRITLKRTEDNVCQLTIRNPQEDDNGEWKFTIQSGQNKTLQKYSHNIIVRENSMSKILTIKSF